MISGFRRYWKKPFWSRLKKHFCQNCGKRLILQKEIKIIKKGSSEAENYSMTDMEGNPLMGDLKIIKNIFKCNNCSRTYEIMEQFNYEKKRT